ncbi:MAG: release factor glutamine methyltransferase [Microgenomates group bacterium Gr01-1014_80]|nr:MAG: release factor glutamine methyltransferase [Microgenomates group bacterium Gr01-1014_80]
MADSTQSSQHSNKPKQYVQGWVEFYKLKFKVTPDVLIPRPESELLVDAVIDFVIASEAKQSFTILDIGTGSGNLAISIAKNLPKARVFATDISESALEVARENAKKNRVEKRMFFIKSNLLDSIGTHRHGASLQNDKLIIITNLPYIPRARISYLDPSVRDFEPIIALDGGSDGFDLYRKLFQQIRHKFLRQSAGVNRNGLRLIVCEIDYTHGELAPNEAQKYFPEASVEVKTDLAKKQRILVIHLEALPK